ncbi:MAG: hypothetical protein AB1Z98_05280 [Nannocystaceae bacterium]
MRSLPAHLLKVGLGLVLGAGLLGACAPREYLTPAGLSEIAARDPELQMVRVYPSAKFIVVYQRGLGEDYDIERSEGSVVNTFEARRVEVPIPRDLKGAILEAVQEEGGRLVLWVSFDTKCQTRDCAYGFAQTEDGLYRLFQAPAVPQYSEPTLYRKRISRRKRMSKTKVYSRSRSLPVYFTTRGMTASIALEIKKQERVEIDTIKVQNKGVPGEIIVAPEGQP